MFILCDDIMELIGKEVEWKRNREKWNRFYTRMISEIHPDFYDVLDYMEHKKLKILWFYWKEVIYNKYKNKERRWFEIAFED